MPEAHDSDVTTDYASFTIQARALDLRRDNFKTTFERFQKCLLGGK